MKIDVPRGRGQALSGVSPVLTADMLRELARQILAMTSSDTAIVRIEHTAVGMTRFMQGRVHLSDSGDTLRIHLTSRFGQRVGMNLSMNQTDVATLRLAVRYLEQVASQQVGDPMQTAMPILPRTYLPNTTWHESTAAAFDDARHAVAEPLVMPGVTAGLLVGGFIGVSVHAEAYADKQGLEAAGQETDSEIAVQSWTADGRGAGWAGQAARDWALLKPDMVATEAVRLTRLAANPVLYEPGRRIAILDRPAVAQIVARMGRAFDAVAVLNGWSPLYDSIARRPRLGERIVDARITMASDPNDPDGGYLPFNGNAYPLIPMRWIDTGGILAHLAYETNFAAAQGVTPANDWPQSLRMSGGPSTIEEMIANCEEGIYVNRFSNISDVDSRDGLLTGLTSGGCYLIKQGKITKAIRHFRFLESPWYFLNRVEAIGRSERTAFGYAPWQGGWPVPPTIVPPLMIRDFNFNALADNV